MEETLHPITKKDLEKFGYALGCPAYDATQIGKELQASSTPTGVEIGVLMANKCCLRPRSCLP